MKRITFWLAYPSTPRGGIARVLDEIEALDIGACLSIRIGQAGRLENGVDEKFVQRCIDRLGLDRIEIWWGSAPSTVHGELYQARKFHALGVQRFVVNAETAWKFEGSNMHAAQFSENLLKGLPGARIAHAPFAMWRSHGVGKAPFPYLGFAALYHAYNQFYPNEFGGSRAYWGKRYEEELRAFRNTYPVLQKQTTSILGDLYGSDFGRSWKLTPAAVKWSDEHLDSQLALSKKMGDEEIAFYSIDAALSETERTDSKPWEAVKRWAATLRKAEADTLAAQVKEFTSEEELMCLDPAMAQACYDRSGHIPGDIEESEGVT